MGAAVLITLGVLFLLQNYNIAYFERTWPALLIVVGVFSFGCRTASIEGHVQPYWVTGANVPPAPPQDPQVKP
jgi:cell wall-active antibiotic response 4TMS protein YvqF